MCAALVGLLFSLGLLPSTPLGGGMVEPAVTNLKRVTVKVMLDIINLLNSLSNYQARKYYCLIVLDVEKQNPSLVHKGLQSC